ncbi:g4717 [Coccomyxa elongata]
MPFLGQDISPLTLSVQNIDQSILRVTIGAPNRWEVPQDRLFTYTAQVSRSDGSTTTALFSTAGSRLVFKDQYLEISSKIPSTTTLYGLGEQASSTGLPLRRDGLPYTLWTRDQPTNVPNVNSYGHHPFIMDVRQGGQAHGILLLNSNGIDVVLTKTKMQFRAIGGILDLYFFMGPTPLDVLAQLTSIIGRPAMPPYWSMGLQQSKYGYLSLDYCERVVENYTLSGIPLETFVTDTPYLDQYQDFTVPILDPQIHMKQGYAPYDEGIKQDVFVKDVTGNNYVGQSLPVSARHADGNLEYNVHNLYGLAMAIATSQAIKAVRQKRPFTLTRSTYVGSGSYAAHWTGDTASTWDDLKWGPAMMMTNGMSGIAFVGGDICGFQFVATEELCARWAAAGAWQPFARNHHAQGFQEFYLWPSVSAVAKKVFMWRLRVMPYLYTAFYDAHTFGCSIMRPLFFSFPGDSSTYSIDQQWMLGDALLVAPIMTQGTSSTMAYFPSGVWYNLYDHTAANLTDNTPVFILGGNIIPIGPNGTNTTTAARAGNLTLTAAMPTTSSTWFDRCGKGCAAASQPGELVACGHMYLDQGEELTVGTSLNNYLSFEARLIGNTAVGYQGTMVLFWPGAPGGSAGSSCDANVTWPMLTAISVLGSGPVNTASVAIMELGNQFDADSAFTASSMVQAQSTTPPTSTPIGGSSIVYNGLPLPTGSVAYNSMTNELSITNLGYQLKCPNGLKITWSSPSVPETSEAAG